MGSLSGGNAFWSLRGEYNYFYYIASDLREGSLFGRSGPPPFHPVPMYAHYTKFKKIEIICSPRAELIFF